jgi:hypothetical protein
MNYTNARTRINTKKKGKIFYKKIVLFPEKESGLMVPTFDTLTGEAPEGIGTLTGRQAQ